MTLDQIKVVTEFLNALGVDTTALPVTGFNLDVDINKAPKLVIRAIPHKDEHFQALAKLKEVSPDVTVQWYDPRLPVEEAKCIRKFDEEIKADQPTIPFAEPVVDLNKE